MQIVNFPGLTVGISCIRIGLLTSINQHNKINVFSWKIKILCGALVIAMHKTISSAKLRKVCGNFKFD